jgi:AraC-like DNA-binding protein
MDALAALLDGPRARAAFLLRSVQEPPWAVRVQDGAPLSVVAVAAGSPWVVPDRGDAVRLHPRDVAVMRGPAPFTFADDPATPVHVVIRPGPRRTTPAGNDLRDGPAPAVRTWGVGNGSARLLIGKYRMGGEISHRLLLALPPMVILRADHGPRSGLVGVLDEEMAKDEPGQQALLDRLLDLLLVAVLRAWFAGPDAAASGWPRTRGDPVVGPVLRLLDEDPARRWRVADLADEAGVSRAALARRFTEIVGEPPMAYLTRRRLDIAADLLRDPHSTVGAVARQVGYGDAFALSAAFKRVFGLSPQQYRAIPPSDDGRTGIGR